VAFLKTKHGPELMFHQSGGCCDNSAANCYLPGEITMGAGDVYLGDIGGCPFYIGKAQYEYWKHTQLIIDVIEGRRHVFAGRAARARPFTPARGCSLTVMLVTVQNPNSANLALCMQGKRSHHQAIEGAVAVRSVQARMVKP
jgi:uncharacterized protein (DUF779 family)